MRWKLNCRTVEDGGQLVEYTVTPVYLKLGYVII